jgi:hypothetical protein
MTVAAGDRYAASAKQIAKPPKTCLDFSLLDSSLLASCAVDCTQRRSGSAWSAMNTISMRSLGGVHHVFLSCSRYHHKASRFA